MPFCPKCKYEYVEGIKVCSDCDVELVDSLEEVPAEKQDDGPVKLVTVRSYTTPIDAEMAKMRLESEGIEVVLANEILSRLDGPIFQYYPVNVQVREEDAERAAEILQS